MADSIGGSARKHSALRTWHDPPESIPLERGFHRPQGAEWVASKSLPVRTRRPPRPLNLRVCTSGAAPRWPDRFCVTKHTNEGDLRMFDPQNRRTCIRYQGRNGDVPTPDRHAGGWPRPDRQYGLWLLINGLTENSGG